MLTELLVAAIGFGAGIAVEGMRTRGRIKELERGEDRKDLEHRQSYYHQLTDQADTFIWQLEHAPPADPPGQTMGDAEEWGLEMEHHEAELRRVLGGYRTLLSAVETFGSKGVMLAGRQFLESADSDAEVAELRRKREAIIDAARADVAAPE